MAKTTTAGGHPLRRQILDVCAEAVQSPSQVAERLGMPLAKVAYHINFLVKTDALELVETRQVRGGGGALLRGQGCGL